MGTRLIIEGNSVYEIDEECTACRSGAGPKRETPGLSGAGPKRGTPGPSGTGPKRGTPGLPGTGKKRTAGLKGQGSRKPDSGA